MTHNLHLFSSSIVEWIIEWKMNTPSFFSSLDMAPFFFYGYFFLGSSSKICSMYQLKTENSHIRDGTPWAQSGIPSSDAIFFFSSLIAL